MTAGAHSCRRRAALSVRLRDPSIGGLATEMAREQPKRPCGAMAALTRYAPESCHSAPGH
jgi:hypothetical protein